MAALSGALKLPQEKIRSFFRDGRRFAWLLEESLADQHGLQRQGECAGSDLLDPSGGKWEVRGCTKHGVFFCPSGMMGKGRKFDLVEYLLKQHAVRGWVVADIDTFPRVSYWIIPRDTVKVWHAAGDLGPTTQIGRAKFKSLVSAASWTPIAISKPGPVS